MTTTAYNDQFASEPEPVHQPYDVAEILRKNIAYLELELKRQKERAEKAEGELKELREQEPITFVHDPNGYALDGKHTEIADALPVGTDLYARPIPAPAVPAPEIPDGDDFNGTTPHLIQCIEALVRMNDCGVLVPHGIGGHARTLLLASANRLRQQPAPVVPEEWRNIVTEMVGWWDDKHMTMSQGRAIRDKASALLQSAGGGK